MERKRVVAIERNTSVLSDTSGLQVEAEKVSSVLLQVPTAVQ
jgi:hypothetical protein